MSNSKVFQITGVLQKYAWGKHGEQSEVSKLFSSSVNGFAIEPSTPYAELWLGTHPKGPSIVKETGELLSSWLHRHPETNQERSELPFLLKVLSVETALSIQIHPNKEEAVVLHAKSKKDYPDNNHKPEMAIALTPFEALCGFRPWNEIADFIENVEELRELIGLSTKMISSENLKDDNHLLKTYFIALMFCNEEFVKVQSTYLVNRIERDTSLFANEIYKLFLRLNSQYPGDVGCFCVFFLNYITLQPGQSIFLDSGLPHAYIKGDCIECMACSDNVIRAGLTPKFRDVASLCNLVKYSSKSPTDIQFVPSKHSNDIHITIYNPPTPEFSVDRIELPGSWESYNFMTISLPSILLVIDGSFYINSKIGIKLNKGCALFIGPNEPLNIQQHDSSSTVLMYRAYSSV